MTRAVCGFCKCCRVALHGLCVHRRLQEVDAHKTGLEHALEAAQDRLARYESEYGLEDAVREQEHLREAIRKRDADVTRLTSTVAEQLDQYDKLEEICRRLCERAGLSADTDIWRLYSDSELRTTIQSTVERCVAPRTRPRTCASVDCRARAPRTFRRLRSANQELIRQNDALEEQRTRLLRQLRVHAEQMGDTALRYYGLTAEQMVLVNEFAENLRNVSDRVRCGTR